MWKIRGGDGARTHHDVRGPLAFKVLSDTAHREEVCSVDAAFDNAPDVVYGPTRATLE